MNRMTQMLDDVPIIKDSEPSHNYYYTTNGTQSTDVQKWHEFWEEWEEEAWETKKQQPFCDDPIWTQVDIDMKKILFRDLCENDTCDIVRAKVGRKRGHDWPLNEYIKPKD